jgi:hypothetical protein
MSHTKIDDDTDRQRTERALIRSFRDTYYDDLSVSRDASQEEIKIAYRQAMRVNNPNDPINHELIVTLNRAYDVLGRADYRALYDAWLGESFVSRFMKSTSSNAGASSSARPKSENATPPWSPPRAAPTSPPRPPSPPPRTEPPPVITAPPPVRESGRQFLWFMIFIIGVILSATLFGLSQNTNSGQGRLSAVGTSVPQAAPIPTTSSVAPVVPVVVPPTHSTAPVRPAPRPVAVDSFIGSEATVIDSSSGIDVTQFTISKPVIKAHMLTVTITLVASPPTSASLTQPLGVPYLVVTGSNGRSHKLRPTAFAMPDDYTATVTFPYALPGRYALQTYYTNSGGIGGTDNPPLPLVDIGVSTLPSVGIGEQYDAGQDPNDAFAVIQKVVRNGSSMTLTLFSYYRIGPIAPHGSFYPAGGGNVIYGSGVVTKQIDSVDPTYFGSYAYSTYTIPMTASGTWYFGGQHEVGPVQIH